MPLLGDIFGAADAFKRSLADLMRNPLAAAQQRVGLLGDQANAARADLGLLADQNALRAQGSVMADAPMYRQAEDASRQRMFNALMNFAPVGATVWHGSPHKFDKFDASKIGTGEGAQAYGHGLYLAEHPGTAEFYKKTLTDSKINIDGKPYYQAAKSDDVKNLILESGGDINKAIGMANDLLDHFTKVSPSFSNRRKAQEALQELQNLQKNSVLEKNQGNLYKVDLPDEAIAEMLDWDKPLSQQSREVQKAVEKYTTARIPAEGLDMGGGGRILANHNGQVKPNSSSPYVLKSGDSLFDISEKDVQRMLSADKGEAAYTRLTAILGGQPQATDYLRQAGIPGIRYLDGGSRGAGQGTSNYVVFPGNEGLLNILERNGKPIK